MVPATAYQFEPKKAQTSLYALALNTTTKFIHRWNSKNNIRKRPDTLINTFFPIELLKNPFIAD
jgi:hypothetical protein